MIFLIASDIHGDATCCKKLLEAFEREGADKILLLGDVLYHGPRNDLPEGYAPKSVIAMLNAMSERIISVRGNCEAEVDQMVLSFPVMADYKRLEEDGKRTVFMSHGHIYSPDKLPSIDAGSLFLSGHTHVLKIEERNGIICVNPGSVSLPKEGNPKSYAIYDGDSVKIKTLEGDIIAQITLP